MHRSRSLLVALLLSCFASTAFADGFIIVHEPHPVPGHFPFAPLEVVYHRVKVDIDGRVAVTSVDQEFHNPGSNRTEGTYMFPLPPGANIDKFSMDVNGEMVEAELLPAEKARKIYEDIVRKSRDPALLEYVGRDAFKVRIFPIEPHGKKRIKIKYTQILNEDAELVEYVYPLNTEKFSSKPLGDVSVVARVKSDSPIRNIYCPSHDAEIARHDDRSATVGYEERNARPDTDFKLYFSRAKDDVDVKLMSYKAGDEGYFMLMASPGVGAADAKPSPKDIAFVIDTSGSMAHKDKLAQAKKALEHCLANLNEGDRFDVVRFSTEAEPLFGALENADREHVRRAKEHVEAFKPTGGTAIDDALRVALQLRPARGGSRGDDATHARPGRPFLIVFLTDGAPTIGVTDEDEIVQRAVDRADDVRIFCFGVGHDVNTHLLDRVADATRAASNYVLPDEDIEVKVSAFYAKVKEPAMTDLKVDFGGDINVSRLYPAKMPDLFRGDTLLLFGRYRGDGPSSVKVSGIVDGQTRQFAEDVNFTKNNGDRGFIPRLWATRRVGWLLDEIRLHGESDELKDEVVKLAREHGIVTPYTAYLIVEDERRRGIEPLSRTFQDLERDADAFAGAKAQYDSTLAEAATPARRSGEQAMTNAMNYGRLKTGSSVQAAQAADALAKSPATLSADLAAAPGYRAAQNYAQQSRVINGRAFYQNGKTWTDATAQNNLALKQKQVRFNSDEYFELVRSNAHAAPWLSLGNDVDVVIGDTLYQVRDN